MFLTKQVAVLSATLLWAHIRKQIQIQYCISSCQWDSQPTWKWDSFTSLSSSSSNFRL